MSAVYATGLLEMPIMMATGLIVAGAESSAVGRMVAVGFC
jgi:hypothetical protein